MAITVYKMNASSPARTVLITAEILGLDIETKELNILEKQQFAPEYLEKNPLHTVPFIEDGELVLADSHAIAIYLISKYGGEKAEALYPSDLEKRAVINQRLFFDASILFCRFLSLVIDVAFGGATSVDEDKASGVEEAYCFLEKYLERSTFVAGEHMTIADISCVTSVSTANIVVPLDERYPKVQAWLEALSKEEWYKKKNQPGLTDFGLFFAAAIQKNAE